MTKTIGSRFAAFAAGLLLSFGAMAAGGGALQQAGTDLEDKASLQRGAALYMNYCAGCHSLKYLRYARIGEDLGLTEDEVQQNLNLNGGKIGDHVISPMSVEMGVAAFGKAPPDLSVISRVRGSDWIYTYLKSFYLDESRPVGWNNKLFPNASMPNPLWELQGLQQPVYGKKTAAGEMPVEGFTISQPGTQDAAAFDQTARDITAFLEYAGEPAATKRQGLGVWVILFLAFFTLMAWLLKTEYWRDVH
ncbi:MAG TPA: cytochrome c1 [Thermomonas sp.]|nr:cytochrome c1 [Thermomonas sp.]